MQFFQFLFNLLPDIAGYLFAMIGMGLLFIPEEMKKLENQRKARLAIASIVILLGFGAVISNSYQKSQFDETARNERDSLNVQISNLLQQQKLLI